MNTATLVQLVETAVNKYLLQLQAQIIAFAEQKKPKRIQIQATHSHKGVTIRARGPGAATLAFDHAINVPVGGFDAYNYGIKAFPMHKEGTIIFRRFIYKKYSGQTIYRRGFFTFALEKSLTPRSIAVFGSNLAVKLGYGIAEQIVRTFREHGIEATLG